MQKKLIVLAIAALASTSAFADSTTTVYGIVDAAVVNVTGSGLVGGMTAVSGGLAASRLGVKNVEDLDNGMKAIAIAEIGLDSETSQGYSGAARQALLGLAGGFGTVATGYLQTTGWDWGSKYNVVAGSALSPLGDITKKQGFLIGDQATANRAQRAIAYISPNISGLTVAVNYASALSGYGDVATATPLTTVTATLATATLVSLDYTAGPLAVGLVYAGTNNDDVTANRTEYALGASYALPAAKITATYQTSKLGNAIDAAATPNATSSNSVYSIGAAIPVATGTLALSYAASNIATTTTALNASQNATGYGVAFLQPLSKTTTAYVGYSSMKQSDGTANVTIANDLLATSGPTPTGGVAGGGGTTSILALGLNKKF